MHSSSHQAHSNSLSDRELHSSTNSEYRIHQLDYWGLSLYIHISIIRERKYRQMCAWSQSLAVLLRPATWARPPTPCHFSHQIFSWSTCIWLAPRESGDRKSTFTSFRSPWNRRQLQLRSSWNSIDHISWSRSHVQFIRMKFDMSWSRSIDLMCSFYAWNSIISCRPWVAKLHVSIDQRSK